MANRQTRQGGVEQQQLHHVLQQLSAEDSHQLLKMAEKSDLKRLSGGVVKFFIPKIIKKNTYIHIYIHTYIYIIIKNKK